MKYMIDIFALIFSVSLITILAIINRKTQILKLERKIVHLLRGTIQINDTESVSCDLIDKKDLFFERLKDFTLGKFDLNVKLSIWRNATATLLYSDDTSIGIFRNQKPLILPNRVNFTFFLAKDFEEQKAAFIEKVKENYVRPQSEPTMAEIHFDQILHFVKETTIQVEKFSEQHKEQTNEEK